MASDERERSQDIAVRPWEEESSNNIYNNRWPLFFFFYNELDSEVCFEDKIFSDSLTFQFRLTSFPLRVKIAMN